MKLGSERGAVQNPFLQYAEQAGWTYLTPDEALALRHGLTSPVLDSVLIDQLQALNPGIVGPEQAQQFRDRMVRVRPTIEGNFDAWEFVKGLKTIFVDAENRERNVRLFDLTDIGSNQFHVTDEFTFSNGTPPDIRTDMMLFINGFPVIVGEAKSAKIRDGIALALDDIRYYHKEGAELLAIMQLHCLTHLVQFYYGATWNLTRKGLFNWRDEQAGDFETLVKSFVDPKRVLVVVNDFILFTRKDGDLEKSVLRPHQMRAAEKGVQRAKEPDKRRGLIWHTQGSGKTYTMITTANLLIEDSTLSNPTVLMLVDRNELESQLFNNLAATLSGDAKPLKRDGYTEFGPYCIADSKKGLRNLLAADRRGLIVSMIHKFEDIPADICLRDNVYVLVDEAHRSTGGDLGNYLMGALPNATYLGFTGTPIDRTAFGKGTFKVFGAEDEKGYLDKYSIKESVLDGTTVPLHYQIAPNDLLVDRETLEKEFLGLADAEGVSDIEELNKVLDRAVTLKNMLKNEQRVDKLAKFVAEHYLSTIEPMGYKAFLVAVDREGCAMLKDAIDKYLPPEYSEVVMSSAGKKDSDRLRKYQLSEDDEKAVRKQFRKPGETPHILIVTEKLLTGFDAPVLYCMYLDKPMRDHVLLQAIARVNRPYEDEEGRRKPCGFVLDFVGIFEKLETALAFDSKDVEGVIEGMDVLKKRFEQQIDVGRQKYLQITKGHKGDKAVEAVLEYFRDKEPREEFFTFFTEMEELHEIISPDPFMRPFIDDFTELASMCELVRGCYERGVSVDKEFMRKTAILVRRHTETSGIQQPTQLQKLNTDVLQAISDSDQPDTVKVFNLLKTIDQLTRDEAAKEPYLLSIGEKAEQIAASFEDRQQSTMDTLSGLEKLLQEVIEARKQREATQLSAESFAVYWLLKRQGVAKADEVAKAAAEAFDQNPHWQTSSHQEQEVRKSFYKALISAGVDGVVEVAQNILKMLKGTVK